jgi:hypothetical protein
MGNRNLALVMRALGHTNAQTAMIYQHSDIETVRSVMNGNLGLMLSRHSPRHTAVMREEKYALCS